MWMVDGAGIHKVAHDDSDISRYLMNHTSMVIVCDQETKFLLYKLNFSWIGDYLCIKFFCDCH